MDISVILGRMHDDLNRSFRSEVRNLTPEQLSFRAGPNANPIIFILWHWARTQDGFSSRLLGTSHVWVDEKWYEKFGLEPKDMGTGFTSEQVGNFNPPLSDVMDYFQRVWEIGAPAIGKASDAELERVPDEARPEMTVSRSFEMFLIGHGFYHLGEIRFIKGLQGIPFMR